jgi:beta-glucosidase/6-phospho-beta-glucosidase/beta-galactosidase
MQRIPDPSQRATYDIYLRGSFKRKGNLVPKSREAKLAIEDGMEQLESMNYYHSIRVEKQRRQTETDDTAKSPSSTPNITSMAASEKSKVVEKWLTEALPQLHADDIAAYSSLLVEDGFDSVEVLETELLAEDLDFMKKAHRRALIRVKDLDK